MKTVIQGIPMSHIAIGLAVLIFVFTLPAIFDPKKFRHSIDEFFSAGNAVLRTAALFHFLVAFLILNTHWTIKFSSTRSIMTVLGYLLLLRGIVWIWFPDFVREKARKFLQKEYSVYVMGFAGLAFTVGLGYLGWWVY